MSKLSTLTAICVSVLKRTVLILFSFLAIFNYALAFQETQNSSADIGPCLERPENPLPGFICRTSQWALFERFENGYMDLGENGKAWYDAIKITGDQPDAEEYCKSLDLELPSGYSHLNKHNYVDWPYYDSDFVLAEQRGIREVFRDMEGFFFWTSSLWLQNHSWALVFEGASGIIFPTGRWRQDNRHIARCVGPVN